MLNMKRGINQQVFKIVDLQFVKSEQFSLTCICGSRQRETASSGGKFQLNNLAVKLLKARYAIEIIGYRYCYCFCFFFQ